jgi:hypothetical protein
MLHSPPSYAFMTTPDADRTDVEVQATLSPILQTEAGYGHFLRSAKRALPSEPCHLNRRRPPKRVREDNRKLFQAKPTESSTSTRKNLHQAVLRSFSHSIFSSSVNAVVMLNRAEDAGGARTLKNSGRFGNGQSKPSFNTTSPGSDDPRGNLVSSRGEGRRIQHGTQLLSQLGIVELLEQDERPTFIVDLEDDDNKSTSRLNLLFANPALRAQPAVLESIEGKSDDLTLIFITSTPHREFKSWVLSKHGAADAPERSATTSVFAGFRWRSSTIRGCFRVVHVDTDTPIVPADEKNSGPNLQQLLGPGSSSPRSARDTRSGGASYFDSVMTQGDHSGTQSRASVLHQDSSNDRSSESSRGQHSPQYGGSPTSNGDLGISEILTSATDSASSNTSQKVIFPVRFNGEESRTMNAELPSEPGFFDWTRLPMTPAMPLHIQFARSIDWSATSLGSGLQPFFVETATRSC